jgi:hypothetical protein
MFLRKSTKPDDQVVVSLKRWWIRNPSASIAEIEAQARGLRNANTRKNNGKRGTR